MYYVLSLAACVLGLCVNPLFFVPALLDIVYQSRLLQKVIDAVTVNLDSLCLTFMLVLIVIYQFTILGELFFLRVSPFGAGQEDATFVKYARRGGVKLEGGA